MAVCGWAPGNDGNASMPEQVNRPNPWKMMMMIIMMMYVELKPFRQKPFRAANHLSKNCVFHFPGCMKRGNHFQVISFSRSRLN
jgi:hypothetical protein